MPTRTALKSKDDRTMKGPFIQSLQRGLGILEIVAKNGTGVTMAEVSREIGLHTSTTFHLIRLAHARGQLKQAEEIYHQCHADINVMLKHPEQELPALGCLDIALGCVYLEQNRLDEAEQSLMHGLELSGWGMIPFYLMIACLALYRLHQLKGQSEKANEYLTRLAETWPDIVFCVQSYLIIQELHASPQKPAILAKATAWWLKFFP